MDPAHAPMPQQYEGTLSVSRTISDTSRSMCWPVAVEPSEVTGFGLKHGRRQQMRSNPQKHRTLVRPDAVRT